MSIGTGGSGGGGGPIGIASGYTGPTLSFETIGNHGYAYSGSVTVAQNTETTMSEFETGNFYTIAELAIQGNFDSMGTSSFAVNVYLNGSKIVESETSASNDSIAPFDHPLKIVIPGFTTVKITVSKAASGNHAIQTLLTGRIYA
jgi:hypothetical protein